MAKEQKQEMEMEDGILGLFGLTMEDVKKKNQKSAEDAKGKKTEQPGAKEKTKSSGKRYTLPIRICSGHLSMDIQGGEGEKTMGETEIKNHVRNRFKELAGLYFLLVDCKPSKIPQNAENIKTFLKLDIKYQQITKEEKIKFPVTLVTGDYSMDVVEEKPLSEIEADWAALHSEYRDCKFYYDEKQNILVPFMTSNVAAGRKFSCPIRVGYLDQIVTFEEGELDCDEEGNADIQEIRKKYSERMEAPEFENCEFHYQEEDSCLFPVITFKKSDVKEVALPVTVRIPGVSYEFEVEDFHKKFATLEEVRKKLEEFEPQYTKERTELQYDERGFVVAILVGSRKGVKIHSDRKNQGKYFIKDRDGNECRVEQTPYGFFCSCSCRNIAEFVFTGPKVPGYFLRTILHVMRRTPDKEIALQLFFNPKGGWYYLYQPKQEGTAGSVTFDRNYERECSEVLVMDIHSHGRMPAFFSSVDNADEKGTQLYLVIGGIGTKAESYAFRAGIAGKYAPLQLDDIFDIKKGVLYGSRI